MSDVKKTKNVNRWLEKTSDVQVKYRKYKL